MKEELDGGYRVASQADRSASAILLVVTQLDETMFNEPLTPTAELKWSPSLV